MNTCEVLNYLLNYCRITGNASDEVFVGNIGHHKYDIYMDDYSKEIFVDKFDSINNAWIYKCEISNIEFNQLINITNWG